MTEYDSSKPWLQEEDPFRPQLYPNLLFAPEEDPMPTILYAMDIHAERAAIIQALPDGTPALAMISMERNWELQPIQDEEQLGKDLLLTGMVPLTQPIFYSCFAEVEAVLWEEHSRRNPPTKDIPREQMLELFAKSFGVTLEEATEAFGKFISGKDLDAMKRIMRRNAARRGQGPIVESTSMQESELPHDHRGN